MMPALFCRHLAVLCLLAALSISQASEVITWNLTYDIYPWTVISGQTTNGNPIIGDDSPFIYLSATLTNSSLSFDPSNQNLSLGASLSGSCECLQDLWFYNQPGQNGPITITATPSFAPIFPSGIQTHSTYEYSLTISQNGNPLAQQQYQFQYSSVITNSMGAFTFSVTNSDRVTFDMLQQSTYGNGGLNSALNSSASYTFSVSANGFFTNTFQAPVYTPQITRAHMNIGHTLLSISGTSGPTNGLQYYVLSATDPAVPMSNWTPYQTNTFATNGTFSFSFPVNAGEPQRFIRLQIAQ